MIRQRKRGRRPGRWAAVAAVTGLTLTAVLPLSACGGSQPDAAVPDQPAAPPPFEVRRVQVQDMKPAFAQIDSADAVPARARINGTIAQLRVREGDRVARGQVLAVIADARVGLQAQAEGAQTQALAAQLAQARADLRRYERLHAEGFFPAQRLDAARAEVRSLEGQVQAAQSLRAATAETGAQGAVLAPVAGTVLRTPVRPGGVAMMGEEIALVGSAFLLKLRLPERHAAVLRVGAEVAVERPDGGRDVGRVVKIYPALADGRVEADVEAPGLAGRVFGERVRVWTPANQREALVVPERALSTRFGVDFARLRLPDGSEQEIVVRRGEPVAAEGVVDGVELLAGVGPGDKLVVAP